MIFSDFFLCNIFKVIGDKTAWDTAVMLRRRGTDAIYEMEEKLGVKVKFIHVVRNPFDNIATFVLRHRDIQARNADPNIKVSYTNNLVLPQKSARGTLKSLTLLVTVKSRN